ncbi:hypothetical protein [Candidatus Weimeria sp. HCP3S3_B5]|uniref:hypothetical protein n=1 Tax=Candidatus Weimeria sp. HCP3S3_B5 TaxID=3438871 RepID=UPI002A9DB90E|nr:hypothetical protein [Lachnospiraceae bacterium]MDY6351689.1 hypothetical protein [Lachnospiraceae bacterium]
MEDSIRMTVSSVCTDMSGRNKYAYVTFSDKDRYAEGVIPDCRITKNRGFSDEELAALKFYMKSNLDQLKKIAAQINVFEALKK